MLQAIILGLVQGLTEFLPVSSSGHLVIVPYLMSWEQPPLAFDVALHLGTLVAVIAYFAGDLWYLATRSVGVGVVEQGEAGRARRTIGLLALGTLPAAAAGFFLEDMFERTFGDPRLAAMFLLVTAALLVGAEWLRRRRAVRELAPTAQDPPAAVLHADTGRDESTIGWGDSFTIGVGQALAIFPGISRAGATIVAGMGRGLSREGSARFSFLLSIPAILGASILKLGELSASSAFTTGETVAGVAVAALSGFWAIRYLLRLVSEEDLIGFARYVALFGVLTLLGSLWIGPPSAI